MKKLMKGCLMTIGALVLLGIVGALLGRGGHTGGSAANGSAAPLAGTSTAQQPQTHHVGESVQVDEVRWKILEASDIGSTLKSDNQFVKDKTSAGRFVRVRFEIENLSKDMLSFVGLDLLDGQQRTFKSSSDTFQFIPNEESCVLENLNPNVARTCTAIYEVPANSTALSAQVSDLKILGSDSALIDLGLK